KVLPGHIANDPELRQRLEREARVISSLDHPHICALYDVGHQNGLDFLVMQYLEGEPLAARLAKGALPIDQTVRYGIQIAAAVDRAHRAGIVHRDLKPANVMLTKTGAKLLDFGLAALRPPGWMFGGALSSSQGADPTETIQHGPLTTSRTILGTLQYMAPEQLEGRPVDTRSDIFAFGALMYEMATGHKAFGGDSPATVISAILKDDPPSMRRIEPLVPPVLEQLVETCLAKDPDERWQAVHDVKLQLAAFEKTGISPSINELPEKRAQRREGLRRWAAPVAVLIAAIAWLSYSALPSRPAEDIAGQPTRTLISAPNGVHFQFSGDFAGPPVIAPDGTRLAFVGVDGSGRRLLYVRRVDLLEFTALAGTDGATFPFWSPDSRSIGFFADGTLKKIDASGGPPITLAAALNPRGGSWGTAGTIVFVPDVFGELLAIPASGGQPVSVTQVERPKHTTHRWPHFLPDGRRFLFLAASHAEPDSERMGIYVGSVDGTEAQLLLRSNTKAVYASGHLFFTRGHSLLAQRFDVQHSALHGDPLPIADVLIDSPTWRALFDVSEAGLLLYQPSGTPLSDSRLEWFSRSGKPLSVLEQGTEVFGVRLSPEGNRLAVPIAETSRDIWIFSLANGTRRRLTFGTPIVNTPVWSNDGQRVAFSSGQLGGSFVSMYLKESSGAGPEELLIESQLAQSPTDWSPDGRFLAYNQYDRRGGTNQDIWILALGNRKAFPFEHTDRRESDAQFSPDGKWIAYTLHMDREEIYVVPFRDPTSTSPPIAAGRWQISTKGGRYARWGRDGRELFYLSLEGALMVAEVDGRGPSLEVEAVRPLFKVSTAPLTINQGFPYDVSPDGQRFIVNTMTPRSSEPIVLLSHWPQVLRR
ncbi:MAG: protein kinase, partial [Acidobacteria bacterium]|nr:protein kinase [Acidobacteriota bacterium]